MVGIPAWWPPTSILYYLLFKKNVTRLQMPQGNFGREEVFLSPMPPKLFPLPGTPHTWRMAILSQDPRGSSQCPNTTCPYVKVNPLKIPGQIQYLGRVGVGEAHPSFLVWVNFILWAQTEEDQGHGGGVGEQIGKHEESWSRCQSGIHRAEGTVSILWEHPRGYEL